MLILGKRSAFMIDFFLDNGKSQGVPALSRADRRGGSPCGGPSKRQSARKFDLWSASNFAPFVSGLILLAERPIKIGDLVVVGGEEGYVRKISVRSTEVGTFEPASVVIPNS